MKKYIYSLLAALAAIFVFAAGNYHFITGSTVPGGLQVQKKISFSMSETFVNFDELANLPVFMARAKYPLFLASAEKRLVDNGSEKLLAGPVSSLRTGMTKGDVVSIIGQPDEREVIGGSTMWTWKSKIPGRSVTIRFENERAEKINSFGF